MSEQQPGLPLTGRVLGLDLGTVRIGVALSDTSRTVATPREVIHRAKSRADDHRRIQALVEEHGVIGVVVGHPLSLSGERTAAARAVEAEVQLLRELLTVPVTLVDERLTSVEVNARRSEVRRLSDASRRGGRGGAGRTYHQHGAAKGPPVIDDLAASVILQSYLDGQAGADT